ncbi:MAG: Type 1 glutamine amidotransferase-like domain-containing protein [Candidatus Shapirobacteria bacterium]|jgi:peptidase E
MSKRLVLFSQPSPTVFEKLKTILFPEYLTDRVFAYMPSDGSADEANAKYNPIWQEFATSNNAQFVFINNSKRGKESEIEKQKAMSANILIISGGNTFTLLNHLKLSGLGDTIKEFWQKDNIVLSGFSAGAIVLTPKIDIASQPSGLNPEDMSDENLVGITDLTGLNIIDFEIWPHYYEEFDKNTLEKYQSTSPNKIKTVGDEEVIVIDQ